MSQSAIPGLMHRGKRRRYSITRSARRNGESERLVVLRLITGSTLVGCSTVGLAEHEADRKSTRLNSSHTVISYAVFCLKKKIKTSNTTTRSMPNWPPHYADDARASP